MHKYYPKMYIRIMKTLPSLAFASVYCFAGLMCRNRLTDIQKFSYHLTTLDANFNHSQAHAGGTGFIVSYKNKNYLVSCYHVMSAKNPRTDSLLFANGFFPNEVIFLLQSKKSGLNVPVRMSLYDSSGNPLFYALKRTSQNGNSYHLDIAVLPLPIFADSIQMNVIPEDQIDTSIDAWPDKPLSIVGFSLQDGKHVPTLLQCKSVVPMQANRFHNVCLFYDGEIKPGMSGAPIYLITAAKKMKLIAVNSESTKKGNNGIQATGDGPYLKFVLEIIKSIHNNTNAVIHSSSLNSFVSCSANSGRP